MERTDEKWHGLGFLMSLPMSSGKEGVKPLLRKWINRVTKIIKALQHQTEGLCFLSAMEHICSLMCFLKGSPPVVYKIKSRSLGFRRKYFHTACSLTFCYDVSIVKRLKVWFDCWVACMVHLFVLSPYELAVLPLVIKISLFELL